MALLYALKITFFLCFLLIIVDINNVLTVFLNQIISRWQKNADTKVASSISRRQKWNSCRQFSKNCIFPNIQLKGVVNRLSPFKISSDHANRSLMA